MTGCWWVRSSTSITRAANRKRDCACANALQYAMITDRAAIPDKVKEDLAEEIVRVIEARR